MNYSNPAEKCDLAAPVARKLLGLLLSASLFIMLSRPVSADDGDEFLKTSMATHAASDTISYSACATARVTLPATGASPTRTETRVHRRNELLDVVTQIYHEAQGQDDVTRDRHTFGKQYKVSYAIAGSRREVAESTPSSGIVWKEGLDTERANFLGYVFHLGCYLDGYVASGSQRIPNLLISASDRKSVSIKVDGEKLVEVTGKTAYGTITVWLNPTQGYLINRVVVQKSPDDLFWPGLRLADLFVPSSYFTTKKYVVFRAEMVVTGVQQAAQTWVADSGTLTVSEKFSDGSESRRVIETSRDDIDLHPRFPDETFRTDLPIGSPVNYIDHKGTGVAHVWDGEKPALSFVPMQKKRDVLVD